MYESQNLEWRGDTLRLRSGGASAPRIMITQDATYPTMWRVKMPDGLSDMVNRTRAKDAARAILLRILNARETNIEARQRVPDAEALAG
jgi:hypothetical protein